MKNKKGALGYGYLFNYFGEGRYESKVVTGAGIEILYHVFDSNGTEIEFEEEIHLPELSGTDLSRICKVSYDEKNAYKITKNLYVDNLFRLLKGWKHITYEVVGYSIDVLIDNSSKILRNLPKSFKDLPHSEPIYVSEDEFKKFVLNNTGFNISDNVNAQVPYFFTRETKDLI
ncbi:hypothetical protein M2150_001679 [Lachnospiraceae bacterium PM6-15]|uniref:hypothetical protein n=1 Tax=Ohessyouella blattaphilus TaxID=2949333 RepID=UPI003E182EA7